MGVKVVKFGGSSVANATQLRKIKAIVEADPERRYVVVSAPGKRFSGDSKVTDLLYMLKAQADHNVPYVQLFETIKKRYTDIIDELWPEGQVDGQADSEAIRNDLEARFAEIETNLRNGCTEAYVVSRGEHLSAVITAAMLGYDFIDTKDLVLFDNRGRLLLDDTNYALAEELAKHEHAVLPGFYGGKIGTGEINLLSRGGSDVTGSLVARAVDAEIYENWTDVSGMLMADPRIVDGPKPIERISYKELRELSYMGASVLHEDAVFPARLSNIPINIRNTNTPEDAGTIITNFDEAEEINADSLEELHSRSIVKGIAGKKGFTVISVYKNMMNKEIGFVRRALTVLEEQGISFDHIPTGIDSLSVVIEGAALGDKLEDVVDAFDRQLDPDEINVEEEIALIAVVGYGMSRTVGVSAKVCGALADAGINIRMINQGTSEINIIIGVDSADFEKAIRVIYEAFA